LDNLLFAVPDAKGIHLLTEHRRLKRFRAAFVSFVVSFCLSLFFDFVSAFYGDFKKVHRCAVLSAESRAGQYKDELHTLVGAGSAEGTPTI
jgi:hypothetical protein